MLHIHKEMERKLQKPTNGNINLMLMLHVTS